MAEEWITTADAAEMSGYHVNYIRYLVRLGDVQARKFGPTWQVNRQSLINYLESAKSAIDKRWGPKKSSEASTE